MKISSVEFRWTITRKNPRLIIPKIERRIICTSAIVKNVIIVEIKKGSTRKNIATIIVRR